MGWAVRSRVLCSLGLNEEDFWAPGNCLMGRWQRKGRGEALSTPWSTYHFHHISLHVNSPPLHPWVSFDFLALLLIYEAFSISLSTTTRLFRLTNNKKLFDFSTEWQLFPEGLAVHWLAIISWCPAKVICEIKFDSKSGNGISGTVRMALSLCWKAFTACKITNPSQSVLLVTSCCPYLVCTVSSVMFLLCISPLPPWCWCQHAS